MAEIDLIEGVDLPATLYADMAGSLLATEGILQALLYRDIHGKGLKIDIGLSQATKYLALPRQGSDHTGWNRRWCSCRLSNL